MVHRRNADAVAGVAKSQRISEIPNSNEAIVTDGAADRGSLILGSDLVDRTRVSGKGAHWSHHSTFPIAPETKRSIPRSTNEMLVERIEMKRRDDVIMG